MDSHWVIYTFGTVIRYLSKEVGSCFIQSQNHYRYTPARPYKTSVRKIKLHHETQKYGWDNFNLELHSLKDIMLQGHLDRLYTDSWSKPSCGDGKMAYCANICGTYSRVDRIWTHEDMTDKSRNWRKTKQNE